MTRKFHLERRSDARPLADFDDQRWPIACALVILAGFVAGVIWARGDFADPRLIHNGWAQLCAVAVVLVVLVWSSALLERRVLRRVQLCVLLSLLVHLGLVFVLRGQFLELAAVRDRDRQAARSEALDAPPVTLPDYDFNEAFEPVTDPSLEKPVETSEVDAPADDLERQATEDSGIKTPHPPLPQPVLEAHEPSPRDLQRVEVSAPRQAATAGEKLSRQESRAELPPTEPPTPVEVRETTDEEPPAPQPAETARSEAAAAPQPSASAQPVEATAAAPAPRVARARPTPAPQPEVETTAEAPRRQTTDLEAATAAEQLQRVAPRADEARELEAALSSTERSEPTAAAANLQTIEPPRPTVDRPEAQPRRALTATEAPQINSDSALPAERSANAPDTAAVASRAENTPAAAPPSDQPAQEVAPAATLAGRASPAQTAATASTPSVDSSPIDPPRATLVEIRRSEGARAPDLAGDAPHEPSELARQAAPAAAAAAALMAEEVRVADSAGSRQPSEIEASASNTTVARQSAAATSAATTAVASTPEVAQRPAASASPRRAPLATAEPNLAQNTRAAALERVASGGDLAAAAADAVEANVDAPKIAAATGGQTNRLQPAAATGRLGARTTDGETASNASRPNLPSSSTGATSIAAPSVAEMAVGSAPRRASAAPAGDLPAANSPAGNPDRVANRATTSADDLSNAADATAEIPDVGPTPDGPAAATTAQSGATPSDTALAPTAPSGERLTAATATAPSASTLRGDPNAARSPLPAVDVPAPTSTAGLRRDRSPAVGLNDPLARRESNALQPTAERFVLERSFGAPTINAQITENPIPEFRQRKPAEREKNAASRGATAGSERAVELGLDFLARHQSADGRWTLDKFDNGRPGYEAAGLAQMQSDTAATGLALLAFFGAGYTHLDGKYRLAVGGALDYLVSNQKPDGDLFTTGSPYVWLYSHGIASIALCEAYGMTRDPRLREPAQRALDFIIAAQHPTQGGWRYAPQRESDTSVSGWQMMALKSGELSGLTVPRTTYQRLSGWLDTAQASGHQGSQYVYLPASRQTQQRSPSMVMTAEALLMRLYLGWERNDPRLVAGADYLLANLPKFGTPTQPARDAYYWYYATQVMFQVQGPHWEAWNAQLRELLVSNQVQTGNLAGSWDPLGPLPDRWGRPAGRIYVTTMHLLMLEVYYRHLPLYRTLGE